MKNLIFINGTMGVGKTATSKALQKRLPNCVFLDGDWCWDADPFVVNDVTKAMVLDNIAYLLKNFLACPAYDNIVFCWVMHEKGILLDLLASLHGAEYKLHKFSLICSAQALAKRVQKDVEAGLRESDVLERALPRLENYLGMDTTKIDVSDSSAAQAAEEILRHVLICF